jgi:uncharacterized membrane protein YkvA (DUF1232 family)
MRSGGERDPKGRARLEATPNKRRQADKRQARSFFRNLLSVVPRFVQLLYRLVRDSRVPLAEKALLLGTLTYVISPLDLLPDLLPVIGQVDDLYLVALVILRLLHRSGEDLLVEHWEGPGDLAALVHRIVVAAGYLLPKRVRQILLGRVEIGPKIAGGLLTSPERAAADVSPSVKEPRPGA